LKTVVQHIVFLTPGFPESEKDSTTIPALQVYLKNLRCTLPNTKMTVLTFQFPFSKKEYEWNGIQVIPFNGKNKRFKKIWIWKKVLLRLKKIHKENPVDNLHSFWIGECSMVGGRFAKKHNINHLVTVMGQDALAGNTYVKYLKKSDAKIVTLSKNHQAKLLENHRLNSIIIPWFLDTTSFPKLQKSAIDILGVGSLNSIKNYTLFIEIVAEVVKIYPNLTVEIIGEGTYRAQLEEKVQKLSLQHTIKLVGKLSRKNVLKKMTEASILLHTSTYESFGFVFLEALYSGMQIVSHDVGIAESQKSWAICNNQKEIIDACSSFLLSSNEYKKRVIVYTAHESVSAYIRLYHE